MGNLKEMLKRGRVVVINYDDNGKETGVVSFQEETIKTRDGIHKIENYNKNLINNNLNSTIIKIYELNKDNELELIWDRERDFIDWSTIPVDTKVLVKDFKHDKWKKRYFCKYEDGMIYCWSCGTTSFSANDDNDFVGWEYVELYKEDKNIK